MATATKPEPTPASPATAPPPTPPTAAPPAAVPRRPYATILRDLANAKEKHKGMGRICDDEKVALLKKQKHYDRLHNKEQASLNDGDDLYAGYIRSQIPGKRPVYTSAELARADMYHSMCCLVVKLEQERDSYNAIEKSDALREGIMLASGFDFDATKPATDPFSTPDVALAAAAAERIKALYQLSGLPQPAAPAV